MYTIHPKKASKRYALLGWFVFFSVLAHGLFFALPANHNENPLTVQLSSPLQITVVSSRPASKDLQNSLPAKTNHLVVAETGNKKLPQPIKFTRKTDTVTETRIVTNSVTVKKSTDSPVILKHTQAEAISHESKNNIDTDNTQNVTLNNLRQQLKETIKARFKYPRIARRMGWEGLVGLSLHIEHDGSLNKIRIARSSGHKILDENARKTIQNIGRLQLASNLTIQAADTEIEVLYRLTDY